MSISIKLSKWTSIKSSGNITRVKVTEFNPTDLPIHHLFQGDRKGEKEQDGIDRVLKVVKPMHYEYKRFKIQRKS